MIATDSGIIFDFPAAWEQAQEGSRSVFTTPQGAKINVIAQKLAGEGPANEREAWIEVMFQNALESVRRAMEVSTLRPTRELSEDLDTCKLPCWTAMAETPEQDAFLGMAVVRHSRGVFFVGYEALNAAGAEDSFRKALKMIHYS